jgi:O-antigen ligase
MQDLASVEKGTPAPLRSRLWRVAPALFLFILPFAHTVALRLSALAVTLVTALILWRRLASPGMLCKLPLALWIAVALLSLLWAVDPAYSADELKNELGYSMATFVSFLVLTHDDEVLDWWLWILLAGLPVLCVGALVGYGQQGPWYEGRYLPGPGDFSTHVVVLAPLLALTAYRHGSSRLTYLIIAPVALAMLVAGYLTYNQIMWVALLAEAIVLAALWPKSRRWRLLAVLAAISVLAAGAFLGTAVARGKIQEVSVAAVRGQLASDPRLPIWQGSLELIGGSPWRGVGFGRRSLYKAHPELKTGYGLWHAHNLILNYGVQMGLPGVLAILLLLGCLAARFWRLRGAADRPLQVLGACGLAIVIGMLMKNMTDDFFVRHQALLFWSTCGMLLGYAARRSAEPLPLNSARPRST